MMLGSCLKNSDDNNTRFLSGYFTIDGNVQEGYTLYQDGGGIVKPSTSNIISEVGENGFGNNERALMTISFVGPNMKPFDDGVMITDAKLQSGQYLQTNMPISLAEAEAKGITMSDSSFAINKFSDIWIYRGFVNVFINANAAIKDNKIVVPDVNLVYDEEKIEENKIDFTVLFNRRAEKETNSSAVEVSNSFQLYRIADLIPGNDSIAITIHAEGAKPQNFKIGRLDLNKGNYLPYNK